MPETVAPGSGTDRLLLGFTALPPAFRPAALAYDYGTPEAMVIEFEKDYVPLSDELVYGAASASNSAVNNASAQAGMAAAAPVDQMANQTAASVEKPPANNSAAAKISSIKDMVAASEARLAATRQGLNQTDQDAKDAAISTAALNNSTATIL